MESVAPFPKHYANLRVQNVPKMCIKRVPISTATILQAPQQSAALTMIRLGDQYENDRQNGA